MIDFGVGDPREPTPAFIRQALVDGVTRDRRCRSCAPPACPSSGGRSPGGSAAGSASRSIRNVEIVPTLGSKEAIFSFAHLALTAEKRPSSPIPGARPIRSTSAEPWPQARM